MYTSIRTCLLYFFYNLYIHVYTPNNYVWVGQINIGTLIVKGLKYKFVDDTPALTKSYSDAEFHVHWYYGYWVQGEKEAEENNNMDQGGKL